MTEKTIFRMSEAGECPRALVAERLGKESAPVPTWLEAAAREGKRHEKWVKEDLREEGYVIEECEICPICKERYNAERNGIHVELEIGSFILIGHMDGRFQKNGNEGGLEIKSASQYEFDRWMKERFEGFSEYACQLAIYMIADPHNEWLYIVKNRSSGYQDRRTITELPTDPTIIFSKLETVVSALRTKELPEGNFDLNSIQCHRCRFQKLCLPPPRILSPVEESKLLDASRDWRLGKRMEKEGKWLKEEALKIFEFHTQATGEERWKFDELAISTVHVKARVDYPKKLLLATFTEEQLKPASEIKLPYDYTKVKDFRGEEGEEIGNAEMSE